MHGGCGPGFGSVVLEGGVGRLKRVGECWWLMRCGGCCRSRGSAGTAGVLLGGELQSVCLEFLTGTGKIVGGGFERSEVQQLLGHGLVAGRSEV